MNVRRTLLSFLLPATAVVGLLALPSIASGQGCALCVTQAAQGGNRFVEALRSGILVLVFPPMAISIGLIYVAWRKRNQFRQR
jgi:hypothetical protein